MIRGLCWPPLLSLALQKDTNWQRANESPLSLSGAQLPPLHSGPPFFLPLLCLPSFIYFPSSCSRSFTFPAYYTRSFFLVSSVPLPLRPALPLWIVGLQSRTQAMNQAATRMTNPAPPMRSAFLILTSETSAAALSLRSFLLMRRGRQEVTSGEPGLRLEYQMRQRGLSEGRRLKDGVCSHAGTHLFVFFFFICTFKDKRAQSCAHTCAASMWAQKLLPHL